MLSINTGNEGDVLTARVSKGEQSLAAVPVMNLAKTDFAFKKIPQSPSQPEASVFISNYPFGKGQITSARCTRAGTRSPAGLMVGTGGCSQQVPTPHSSAWRSQGHHPPTLPWTPPLDLSPDLQLKAAGRKHIEEPRVCLRLPSPFFLGDNSNDTTPWFLTFL